MTRFRSVAAALLFAAAAAPLAAQVGHPPSQSPYRDIAPGHTVAPFASYVFGGGGRLGVGPHSGWMYGLRYDIRISGFTALGASISRGTLDRGLADPDAPVATRFRGPVDQTVTMVEAGLQFSLTGQKSWNRLAPFLGLGGGFAFGSKTPADTTRYEFGNKLFLQPRAGLRFFVTPSVQLRGEAGVAFWKLSYPSTWSREPAQDPGTVENPHALLLPGDKTTDWTGDPWLRVGLGITFRP